MEATTRYGLEQARAQLPDIAAKANAGTPSILTRHGKPFAAVVPLADLKTGQPKPHTGLLALRGTGRGLWGKDSRLAVTRLREEW